MEHKTLKIQHRQLYISRQTGSSVLMLFGDSNFYIVALVQLGPM